jgi:UDP-N-acetylmuramate: L-alanyl-gamma-D-glutamyl-meso-diaminopimelate ligase
LTAVEFDHADIYRDLAHVKSAFRQLVELLPAGAPLIVAGECPHAIDVAKQSSRQPTTFGIHESNIWRIGTLVDDGHISRVSVLCAGRVEGEIALRSPGSINAVNALGAYVLCRELGLSHAEIAAGLATFSGVARRQELVGEFGRVILIDDFAHHPTAVAGVIAAIQSRYSGRRLWALFEPRSNTSRRKVFQREYVQAFGGADRVVIGNVLPKATDAVSDAELFAPEQLAADLRQSGTEAWACATAAEITALVAEQAQVGDVVLMMSNGDFGGLRRLLQAELSDDC